MDTAFSGAWVCMSFAESCLFSLIPWSTRWAGKLPCYEVKRSQQRRPSDGGCNSLQWESIKWHAPPKQVLMQTVLHLDAVSSFCIWELSCLIKGKGKSKTGDGELLWEQRHPWQRWSQHRHKHSPRQFWACKGLKLIPPWGSSLHAYLTTRTCYYLSQIGFFLKNSLLACFCSMQVVKENCEGENTSHPYGIEYRESQTTSLSCCVSP